MPLAHSSPAQSDRPSISTPVTTRRFSGVILVWVVMAVASYRHVLRDLIHQWQTNTSYSHGILVIPLAVWLLWHRRATRPAPAARPWLAGVGVLLSAHLALWFGEVFHFPAVGRWSIPIWLSGFIGLAWGRPMLVWSLPSVVFLAFMIPIPFQLELLGNQFMQGASAWCSCYLLGLTSIFAVTDGSALMMPSGRIGISAACSGLRMTVAIAALGYLLAFVQAGRTKRLVTMALLVVPAAIFSNAVRIAVMAWAMHSYQLPSLASWVHDVGDWLVLPMSAAVLLGTHAMVQHSLFTWRTRLRHVRLNQQRLHIRLLSPNASVALLKTVGAPVALIALGAFTVVHY